MNSVLRNALLAAIQLLPALASLTIVPALGAPAAPVATNQAVFSFQDYLNHDWTNELVRVPLSPAQAKRLRNKPALLDDHGQPVPYQVASVTTGAPPTIEFLVNIKAGEKGVYKFGAVNSGVRAAVTDLELEENDKSIRLTNSRIGISLRKSLAPGEGPVESIRLASGKWIGGSRLGGKASVQSYTAKIVSDGPVYKEVECRADFGGGASWVLDFRLAANEPAVVVRENMALGDGLAAFTLSLGDNFSPDKLFFRSGEDTAKGRLGTNMQSDIKPGNVYVLEPWLHWWNRPEEGQVFSLYRDDSPDMLSVGAGFASLWVDPKIAPEKRAAPLANLTQDDKGLHLDFEVKNGRRQWMILTPDKTGSLKVLDDPKTLTGPSLPHQYLIKHGEFPLNLVKDYVLDWAAEGESHPHLLINKAGVAKYRTAHAQDTPLAGWQLDGMVSTRPLTQWNMELPLQTYFATGNPRVEKYLAGESVPLMQELVDNFLKQPEAPYGAAPHHVQILGSTPLIVDAILDSPSVSPELRKKLLAQIAFCSYAVNRPDFWAEERGYSANPNMTTSVLGYEVGLASMIPTHPQARQWVAGSMAGLKAQLLGWSDANGGWLEAPHYAMVSFDAILGSALIAHNAGLDDTVFDPRMKLVINWFSKWSTPKDSRYAGYRHFPPVGNTYISEPCSEFGAMAGIWKDKDPEFASQMQWMFHQQKSPPYPGVGGGYPTMAGYRQLLVDPSIPEKAPPWTSECFPNTGVLLRNVPPSDRETTLLMLAGSFGGWRSHWDDDSGSVTIWGKGRIISDDFGYYVPSRADHNLPQAPDNGSGIFKVQTFAPAPDFDYVSGARGAWARQLAFVKNDDPLAPNFFVVSDTFKAAPSSVWRLCVTATKVTPNANGAVVEGKEDVDTDLYFAAPVTLQAEEKTRTSNAGIRPDGSQGAVATTQIGLSASAPTDGTMTWVLYPRLKTEKAPVITALAGGKGVKVVTDSETDYVFLSLAPFAFEGDGITFNGTSGAVRLRGQKVMLSLGESGSITAFGQTLTTKLAERKEFTR